MSRSDDATLFGLVRLFLRGLVPAAVGAAAVAVAVFLFTSGLPRSYQASATILASRFDPSIEEFDVAMALPPSIDLAAYRSVATSPAMLQRATQFLADPEVLAGATVTSTSEIMRVSSLIRVHARAADPRAAMEVANAAARALVDWDRERARVSLTSIARALEEQIDALMGQVRVQQLAGATAEELESTFSVLADRRRQLALALAAGASTVGMLEVVEPAALPIVPVAPLPRSYAMITFLIVTFLGFGVFLLARGFTTGLGSSGEVVQVSGLELLAEFRRTGSSAGPDPQALGYLLTSLDFALAGAAPIAVVLSSPTRTPVKSRLALSVAQAFAQDARRTLLVDADFHDPSLTRSLRIDEDQAPSLASYLDGSEVAFEPVRMPLRRRGVLDVLPNRGAPAAEDDRLRRGLPAVVEAAKGGYDVVVVDASPLLESADGVAVAWSADAVVLVVDLDSVTRDELAAASEMVARGRAGVVGVAVFGRARSPRRTPRRFRRVAARGYA